jgi:Gpi18-like mannosyltransferase
MQTQESTIENKDTVAGTAPSSISSTWRTLTAPWWQATLAILPVFIITRVVFLLLTYFGGVLFSLSNYSYIVVPLHQILYNWNRWDALRFTTIAAQGYPALDYAAFFPLFPALSHTLSIIIHKDTALTGIIISNLAFLGALIVLYRLVTSEFDAETAGRTTLYLAIFPTALFFFAGYNESLFLFFMLLCFYTLRQGSWWLAGIFGGLATLSRSIGLLLFAIFFYEFLRQHLPALRQAWHEKQMARALPSLWYLLPSLIIPLGLGVYMLGLSVRFGDPLAFTHAQVYWRDGLSAPWTAPLLTLKFIVRQPVLTFYVAHNIIDLSALILFAVLLVLCFVGPVRLRRDQWSFAFFALIALLYSVLFPGIPHIVGLAYDPLPSMQRFVLELFVCFIILARLGRRPSFHLSYLLLSLPLLAFFTLQFLTGHWTI